jgi:hypothetical protein
VITSDRAALSEIAHGSAELVAEPTEKHLTAASWKVLSDPARRAQLRVKGLERAASLQREATARRTLDVLWRVVGGASA